MNPSKLAVLTKFNKFGVETKPLTLIVPEELDIYPACPSPATVDVSLESKKDVDTKFCRLGVLIKFNRFCVEMRFVKLAPFIVTEPVPPLG